MLLKKTTKKVTLNDHISKTRAKWDSRLTLSESSFNFLQNSIIFCALYPRWYSARGSTLYNPRLHCQRLALLKGLMMNNKKFWICSTAKNTVISPNSLVWKFYGKTQFPHSFGRFAWNYAENVPFQKFPNQEIRWNCGIFHSALCSVLLLEMSCSF